MRKYILKVKKEQYPIEYSEEQTFEDFQAKIFSETNIPPKNLKILFKSKMIKDQQMLLAVPDGSPLLVMGTRVGDELKKTGQLKNIDTMMIQEPKKIQKFGLVNIGNTCYMNASIQFLKSVPVLHDLMKSTKLLDQNSNSQRIASSLAGVLREMEKKDVTPQLFVQFFLTFHPQFQPFQSQHDADEFMQKLIEDVSSSHEVNKKVLRDLFEIQIMNTLRNTQIPEEQLHISYQTTNKIGCSLGGNDKQIKVGTMIEGIKLGLETKLQKMSALDNHNHQYESVNRFNSLPPYLIVQMVRFFWKEVNDPDSPFSKPLATKICRAIDFGSRLDLIDFCTEELKEKLKKGREAHQIQKKQEQEQFKLEYEAYKQELKDSNRPETRIMQEFKQRWAAKQQILTEGLDTGIYQLQSVVTHLGNSVESGHYMAWIKDTDEQWTKYDDDTVYQQPGEKVIQLRGGQPNLQIAYLLMFRKVYAKPLE